MICQISELMQVRVGQQLLQAFANTLAILIVVKHLISVKIQLSFCFQPKVALQTHCSSLSSTQLIAELDSAPRTFVNRAACMRDSRGQGHAVIQI